MSFDEYYSRAPVSSQRYKHLFQEGNFTHMTFSTSTHLGEIFHCFYKDNAKRVRHAYSLPPYPSPRHGNIAILNLFTVKDDSSEVIPQVSVFPFGDVKHDDKSTQKLTCHIAKFRAKWRRTQLLALL